jgi:hypothetical protein
MYGISVLGMEGVLELNRTLGIQYFARYDPDVLVSLYATLQNPNRNNLPPALVLLNQSDWNGSFYSDSHLLRELGNRYRLIITEVSTETAFYDRVGFASHLFGRPLSALVIGGHGNPTAIQLGYLGDERQMIDLTDIHEISRLNAPGVLDSNAVLVFLACSTGRTRGVPRAPISQQISTALGGRRTFAPDQDTGITNFIFDASGRIVNVLYDHGHTARFWRGRRDLVPRRIERNPSP